MVAYIISFFIYVHSFTAIMVITVNFYENLKSRIILSFPTTYYFGDFL